MRNLLRTMVKSFSPSVFSALPHALLIVSGLVGLHPLLGQSATVNAGDYATLVSAISSCVDGDVISITSNITVDAAVVINSKGLTIHGNSHSISVPVSGLDASGVLNASASAFGVFTISASGKTNTLQNMTVVGGNAYSSGSGICNNGGTLVLQSVTITQSGGGNAGGGGLYNNGTILMQDCNVSRNAADHGGGFFNQGSMFIERCTFSENRSLSSSGGGGAGENQTVLYANNCTFANNKSTELGGGINNYNGSAYCVDCTFVGNIAYGSFKGGAIAHNGGAVTVVNSLFSYNYCNNSGTYALDDINNYSGTAPVAYYSVFQSTTNQLGSSSVAITLYAGDISGTNDSIFCGGATAKVLGPDGSQVGSGTIYQPFLANVGASQTPTAALQPGSFAFGKGTRTAFSAAAAAPVVGYYTGSTWVALQGSSISNYEVTTDQNAVNRGSSNTVGSVVSTTAGLCMLKVNLAANGSVSGGTIYGDIYPAGTPVTLTAIPASGYRLTEWDYVLGGSGVAATANPFVITLTNNVTVIPVFSAYAGFTVSYSGNGATDGTVPAAQVVGAGESTNVAGPGSMARSGYMFSTWDDRADGNGTDYAPTTTYSGPGNLSLYAKWVPTLTCEIRVGANPLAGGMVNGGGNFLVGSTNLITAVASNGWLFTSWSDGVTNNPRQVVVPTTNVTYTADFAQLPPSITAQPISVVVTNVGQSASLSVSNNSAAPFGYQWFKDGAFLPGQTNSTLTYASFQFTNSGSYYVVITNASGMVISLPATLGVSNATLLAWGNNSYGQLGNGTNGMSAYATLPITVASNVVAVADGGNHSLIMTADGSLWAMGFNGRGQLGNGTSASTNLATYVTNHVVAVAGGYNHSLYVKADGTLWGMGYNASGQLGNGNNADTNRPVYVTNNVVAVAAGGEHSLFVKADGALWAMGYNADGELGNGTLTSINRPAYVTNNVVSIAAGYQHSLFMQVDGSLWAMGLNDDGQLGNGTLTKTNLPTQVAAGVLAIAAGTSHSLFVKADGTLWAMGNNYYGKLGIGTTIKTNLPTYIANHVVVASAGGDHSLFEKMDGSLWAMGDNEYGQLGNGTTAESHVPVLVNGGNLLIASLAKGERAYHSLAIATLTQLPPAITTQPSNAVVTAGQPTSLSVSSSGTTPFSYQWFKDGALLPGQTNSTLTYASFQFTNSGNYYVVITNGFGMAISLPARLCVTNAPLLGWGYNQFGQLGNGTLSDVYRPIAVNSNMVAFSAGGAQSLIVKTDGTLWAMGQNNYGQLGIGTNISTNRPVYVTNNVVTVAAGSSHSLFVKTDGTLWAMGYNYNGQLGNGTAIDTNRPVYVTNNVVAVAAGQSHSQFLKSDGTLWIVGGNGFGQLGIGTMDYGVHSTPIRMTNNVVAMAAGIYHVLFVKTDRTLWALGANSYGQLGNGTWTESHVPILVTNNVLSVSGGGFHSLFLKADNTLWTMGYNAMGQLGNGTTVHTNQPIYLTNDVVSIAACIYHSFFVKSDSALWGVGYNGLGALGDGTGTDRHVPILVNNGFLRAASLANSGPSANHFLAVAEILVPGMTVLGTNGAVIASGSGVSPLNGTRFPLSPLGASATRTFTITNNGTAPLTITSWLTNGANPSAFSLQPSALLVPVASTSQFQVTYTPSAAGDHTAALVINNNSTNPVYTVNLAGSCYQLSTNIGPYAGGNTITITNGNFGNITNVLVGGMPAPIVTHGTSWVTITLPSTGAAGVKDIVIQTSDNGDILLTGAYTVCIPASLLPEGTVVSDAATRWNGAPLGWRIVHTNYGGVGGSVTLSATNSVAARGLFNADWNNRWQDADLRRWLNGTNFYGTFSPTFAGIVLRTSVPWAIANPQDPPSSGITTDSVFIASRTELGGAQLSGDGSVLDWFANPGTAAARRADVAPSPTAYWTRTGEHANWSGNWYDLIAYYVNVPAGTFGAGNWTSDALQVVPVLNIDGRAQFAPQPDGTYRLAYPMVQTIDFPNPGAQITTNTVTLSGTASSSLAVTFSKVSGPAILTNGTTVLFTGTGTVVIVAHQPGNAFWNPAPDATNSFVVTKATAGVTLFNLSHTYDGTAKSATATTSPTGLSVVLTYNGSTNLPINAGNYAVAGTVNDVLYQGLQTGTLVIAKADQTINFTPIAHQVVTNTVVLAATATSTGIVSFSVDAGPAVISGGTTLSFSSVGHVQVRATQSGDSNWNAAPDVTNAFDVIGVITNVTPAIGTVLGGTPVTIYGLWLGNGGDITNVTLCNVAATIVTQSLHSVTVTTGPSSVATNADVVVQSAGFVTVMLTNGFTYHALPLPPTALSAINITSNRFTARWTSVSDATNYLIDVSTTNTFASYIGTYTNRNMGDATACLVTGLLDHTTYYYRVRAADFYGPSTNSNTIVVPVGTNTPYVLYEQTNGVASAGSSDVINPTTLFHGRGLIYTVVTNSNPGLVSAAFAGTNLVLQYAPGMTGTAQITIRATDPSNGFWVETTITVSVVPAPVQTLGSIVLNRQNGLYEQMVTVSNTSPTLAARRVTLTVTSLSANYSLYNATGRDLSGNPEIQWNGNLAPLTVMQFTLCYYSTTRGVPPSATVLASLSLENPTGLLTGTTFAINGTPLLINGTQNFLIEFTAVPGQTYYIQYTAALADPWKTVYPAIVAPVNKVQWVDSGPPGTECVPNMAPNRFYHVIQAAP